MKPSRPPSVNRVFSERPVSVLVLGTHRALTNWFTLGLAAYLDPSYIWTDVRPHEDLSNPFDPLTVGAIPEAQLSLVYPEQLAPQEEDARLTATAAATVVRSDDSRAKIRGFEQFARLPSHTQEVIAATRPSLGIRALVLANAERVIQQFPPPSVPLILGAILAADCSVILSFLDPPPAGRTAFDFVLEVRGSDAAGWSSAEVRCERAVGEGLMQPGGVFPFSAIPGVGELVSRFLPPPGPVRGPGE